MGRRTRSPSGRAGGPTRTAPACPGSGAGGAAPWWRCRSRWCSPVGVRSLSGKRGRRAPGWGGRAPAGRLSGGNREALLLGVGNQDILEVLECRGERFLAIEHAGEHGGGLG